MSTMSLSPSQVAATQSEGNLFSGANNNVFNPNAVGSTAIDISKVAGVEANSAQSFLNFFQSNRDFNNAWSASQAEIQRKWQEDQNAKAMTFNASEAAKNRDWQQMMSNTAHQREVADLQAAGLNPILSAMNGNGAAVTSGATASGVTSSGAAGQTDMSMNQMLVTLLGSFLDAQTKLQQSNINAINNLAVADKQGQINHSLQLLSFLGNSALSYQNHSQDVERDYQKFLRDNDLQNNKYSWEDYLKAQYPTMFGFPIGAFSKNIAGSIVNPIGRAFANGAKGVRSIVNPIGSAFANGAKGVSDYFKGSSFKSDLNDIIGALTGSRYVPWPDLY